jgi:TATA-box binding protein (TBP) (component of TFIID and TFIIIB)
MMALSSKIETINIPRINMEVRNTPKTYKKKVKAVIDCNIDDEWSSFITSHNDDLSENEEESELSESEGENEEEDLSNLSDTESKCDIIEDELEDRDVFGNTLNSFAPKTKNILSHKTHTHTNNSTNNSSNVTIPEPSDIYISTKSKIAYLTDPIDLKIFWDIPVIPYATAKNGVIKKQIKFNSKTPEELNIIQERLQAELYYEEHVMSHIDNPNGRIKFKDIRKVTIGISKKDIMSYRSKKKQAFYNCFVMIIRLKIDGLFREFHIKVFNTGKMEIPGVQNDAMFELVLKNIIEILQPYTEKKLEYNKKSDTVLINSNFNCGFYIDRERLYDILKYKYNIQAIYDPCSYPGIQSKFYYNSELGIQTGIQTGATAKASAKAKAKDALNGIYTDIKDADNLTEVSFMVFRTGSVLIVGMCEENVLVEIYEFLKTLLKAEFSEIYQGLIDMESHNNIKNKKKKIRKKLITVL